VSSHDADDDGVADWEPDYREDVSRMMDLMIGPEPHRTLLWIGAPPMRSSTLNRGAKELDRVMREEADKRAPDVLYVDAYRLFQSRDGGYTDTVTDENGRTIRVRIGDGVHLTPAGAEYLARAVLALLEARFHIDAQADPAHKIDYSIRHGGGTGSGSGSGGRRSTNTTTPPTTVPDTTPMTTASPDSSVPVDSTTVPSTAAPSTSVPPPSTVTTPPAPTVPTSTP
jgi:hypothetical protein